MAACALVADAASASRPPGLEGRIRAERIGLAYDNTQPALVGNILVALLAQVISIPHAPGHASLTWLGGLLIIAAARLWTKRLRDRQGPDAQRHSNLWARRLFFLVFLNGAWWGIYSILILAYVPPLQTGFAPFIIGGMVAAAVATLGPVRSAYLGFTLPMVVCFAAALVWRGGEHAFALAGFAIAFEITMIGTVWKVSEVFGRDISLRLQNECLVQSLRSANLKLAGANESLEREIEERKRAEGRIEHLATHDSLTGLPNRRLQKDRFAQIATEVSSAGGQAAVLFIDLDRFKEVNDTLGHPAGDALLCVVAERLRNCLRDDDPLCRQGGDEFLVVLRDADDRGKVAKLAERIIQAMGAPIMIEGHEVRIGCSIGISLYAVDGDNFEVLVSRADKALYRAKREGRAAYRFFANELEDQRKTADGGRKAS